MKKLKFLTPDQKEFWKENGFIKLGGIFSNKEFEEISNEYNDVFNRKQKDDVDGLEAAWIGDDMKKAAQNINYTVNIQIYYYNFKNLYYLIGINHLSGKVYSQPTDA